MSSKTAATFVQYIRELVINTINENKEAIGGPGIIIKVDKLNFNKCKYQLLLVKSGSLVVLNRQKNGNFCDCSR